MGKHNISSHVTHAWPEQSVVKKDFFSLAISIFPSIFFLFHSQGRFRSKKRRKFHPRKWSVWPIHPSWFTCLCYIQPEEDDFETLNTSKSEDAIKKADGHFTLNFKGRKMKIFFPFRGQRGRVSIIKREPRKKKENLRDREKKDSFSIP